MAIYRPQSGGGDNLKCRCTAKCSCECCLFQMYMCQVLIVPVGNRGVPRTGSASFVVLKFRAYVWRAGWGFSTERSEL